MEIGRKSGVNMNNEINIKRPGQILDYVDTKEHLLELYKYITNLQEELYSTNQVVNELLDVKEENERLNLELSGYREAILRDDKLLGLKSRCEKAIEYITSEETINMFSSINAREKWLKINHKLLNILGGKNE